MNELINIELTENVYPLRTVIKLRLFLEIVDYDMLKQNAIQPKPNTMRRYRPNLFEYLEIEEKTNANSK